MKDKFEIVKELREYERSGFLQNKMRIVHDEPEVHEEEKRQNEDVNLYLDNWNVENHEKYLEPISGKSEDLHELVFQNASDLMIYLDTLGSIIKINEAGLNFLGFRENEFVGKNFCCLPEIFKSDVKDFLNVFKNVLRRKPTKKFLSELTNKYGKKYIMEFSTYSIERNDKIKYILVVGRDVTDHELVEETLKKSEEYENRYRELAEHYEVLTENTLDIIFQTTKTGKITYVNSASKKIAGLEPEEMIGKNFTAFIPKKEMPKYFKILRNTLAGREIGSFESFVYHKDGRLIPVEFDGKLVKKTKKGVIQGTIKDITERKKIEEALQKAHDELERRVADRTAELSHTNKILQDEIVEHKKTEKKLKIAHSRLNDMNQELEKKVKQRTADVEKLLKLKDEFINQLGHDLKNPLNPLINLLPIIEELSKDKESKEMFEIVNRNVGFMKNLVVKTIELARLNSPTSILSKEEINLLDEINSILNNNKFIFENNNIHIENKVSENLVVNADKLKFLELFDNLINNAVKFSPDGGKISVDSKENQDYITISIKDSGIGLSDVQINHIFDEFYKADRSRHDFDSSGLGLPICKRIVEKHGGKIWVESSGLGKGTTILFTIPSN